MNFHPEYPGFSTTGNSETIHETATRLAARGLFPIAIFSPVVSATGEVTGCTCPDAACPASAWGKHPIGAGWQTQSQETALQRISENPGCNIGSLTGSTSGLVIIDADEGRSGDGRVKVGLRSLNELEIRLGPLPTTVTVVTGGGGRQYYFRVPPGRRIPNTASRLGPNVDTRGENGQGVLPPSLHSSGNRYRWLDGCAPWEIGIAELPAAWIEALAALGRADQPQVRQQTRFDRLDQETERQLRELGIDHERAFDLASRYLEEVPGAVQGSGGNRSTFAMACWLIRHVFTYEDAWALLCEWNATCEPPWDEKAAHGADSLQRVLDSAVEACTSECAGNPFAVARLEETTEWFATRGQERLEPTSATTATAPSVSPGLPVTRTRFGGMRRLTVDEVTRTPPKTKWLWEGRIPDEPGSVGSLSGPGGTGKSSLVTGYVLARAQGKPFLGVTTKQGTTVVISTEDSFDSFLRKVAAFRSVDPSFDAAQVAANVVFYDARGEALRLVAMARGTHEPNLIDVEALASRIRGVAPRADLIVLETVSRLALEETNEGYSALIVACETLGREVNATVLLIGHVSKNEARNDKKDPDAYAGRGGAALADNGRFSLVLSRPPKKRVADLLLGAKDAKPESFLLLSEPKLNAGPIPAPVYLRKIGTDFGLTFRPYDADDLTREQLQRYGESVVAFLHANAADKWTLRDLSKRCKEHGVPSSMLDAVLASLEGDTRVTVSPTRAGTKAYGAAHAAKAGTMGPVKKPVPTVAANVPMAPDAGQHEQ